MITLNAPWLEFDLGAPMRVLSWSINAPGFVTSDKMLWPEVRNAHLSPEIDVLEWLQGALAARDAQNAVVLLTSRDIATYEHARAEVEGIVVDCVATVGLSNGERIGTRTDYSTRDWGTINVGLRVCAGLTDAAMIETLSIATQARTAAVMEAGAMVPAGVITGTGTDCIAVAALAGDQQFAGLHTAIGEAVGRAVYDAVYAGAMAWRRTYPAAPGTPMEDGQ